MASSSAWCLFFAILGFHARCCLSDEGAVGLIEKAMTCFMDHHIYVSCQGGYRLDEGGALRVPPYAADDFCGGPCLVETKLVLACVERYALHDFRFYNGASVLDVKYALTTGCSHTRNRGNFKVRDHSEVNPDAYLDYYDHDHNHDYDHDHGSKMTALPAVYLIMSLLLCSVVLI